MKSHIENRPNYRIYDRTGGGVTEDIYAENLDAAIEAGRDWIEQGSWDGEAGVYRTITLECEVREIVYVPDISSIERALTEYAAAVQAGRIVTTVTPADVAAGDVAKIQAELSGLASVVVSGLDEDGDTVLEIVPSSPLPEIIDEEVTTGGNAYDCSGEHSDELPECEAAEDGEHDWRSPHSLVGGLRENPGVWSGGGTIMQNKSVCRCCGCYKTETDKGSQCHESEAKVVIEIEPRDEASESWLKETHEDECWLPDWLATYLDCAPTVRMTEDQAREYVDAHTDDDDLDDDDLEHAFAALTGRRPAAKDISEGLWSHLCARA